VELSKSDNNKPWVLVVDDEAEFARLIALKFEGAGFRTLTCGKVPEAIHKLTNQKFDCIILDIRLEQGSGERVVDVLRSDDKTLNFSTPILLMSGHVDAGIVRRLATKISGVFVKPFESALMVDKVRRLLIQAQATSASG
jgi:CheY-like chemotaxis protein